MLCGGSEGLCNPARVPDARGLAAQAEDELGVSLPFRGVVIVAAREASAEGVAPDQSESQSEVKLRDLRPPFVEVSPSKFFVATSARL